VGWALMNPKPSDIDLELREAILNPAIPICFDTNVLYGNLHLTRLPSCKAKWPDRSLLIPSIVVAEKVRQRIWSGLSFDASKFRSFLANYQVVAFDNESAMDPWSAALQRIEPKTKDSWERARVRWPDYAINAIARRHKAILISEDGCLRADINMDYPRALKWQQFEPFLLS
jgi:predicted nucleic acid-binding protein